MITICEASGAEPCTISRSHRHYCPYHGRSHKAATWYVHQTHLYHWRRTCMPSYNEQECARAPRVTRANPQVLHKFSTIPAEDFIGGIADLFLQRDHLDPSAPGRINRTGKCADCGKRTVFRRCFDCKRVWETASARKRREAKGDGTAVRGSGLPEKAPV